ncbi:MAG: hypothetical protein IJW46_06910 [Clostridia bacterium]|nr:hypothetical protein [Clostridia bacterium]
MRYTVGSCDAVPGETVSIPISLSSNPGFVSMSLSVTYDASALTLISYEDTGVIGGASHSSHFTSPYVLTWENDTRTSNITNTGTIVYLTFLVSEDAKEQDYSIIAKIPTDGILDANGNTVSASGATGTVTVSAEHECSFGDWEYYNRTKHVRYCEDDDCDEKEYDSHNWDDGKVVIKPTHEEDGEMEYLCEDCDAEKTVTIDAEGHDWGDWVKLNDAQHKRSCSCGEVESEAHDFGEWKPHSETYHRRSCFCGAVQDREHLWDDGETVKPPTSTEYGEMRYTCEECGKTKTEQMDKIDPDHVCSFAVSKVVTPTCTEDGYTLYRCEGCGSTKRENIVSATGHSYTDRVVAPTCFAGGYTEHSCQNCTDVYTSDPTAKLTHNYVDGICTYCKSSDSSQVDPPPSGKVAGDINGDGTVDPQDATLLMQYHAGWQVTVNAEALDVNGDMRYNNKDVTRLLQYLAGWDVEIS